jgi:hypothetical protein
MKKVILGLSLLAFVANVSVANAKDKGKGHACCTDKAAAAQKSKSKCCVDAEKSAKTDKKVLKKTA